MIRIVILFILLQQNIVIAKVTLKVKSISLYTLSNHVFKKSQYDINNLPYTGIKSSIILTPKIDFTTGLSYFNYIIDKIDQYDYGAYNSGSTPFSETLLKYVFSGIEIPTLLNVNFVTRDKYFFYCQFGLSWIIRISEKITERKYDYPITTGYVAISEYTGSKVISMMNASIGYNYILNKKLSLFFETYFKNALFYFGENLHYLWPITQVGLGVGIRYNFPIN